MDRRTTARNWILGALFIVLAVGGVVALAHGYGRIGEGPYGPTMGPLAPEAEGALLAALDAEYAAYAAYDAVIAAHGDLEPYATLREAAAHRIDVIKGALERYGSVYPTENPYVGTTGLPGDLGEIASALAERAVERASAYEASLSAVSGYPYIARILTALERATLKTDLPALEVAARNGGELGPDRMARLGFAREDGALGAADEDHCPMEHGRMWGGREGIRGGGPMWCHGDD